MIDVRSTTDLAPYLAVPGFEVSPEQLARQRPEELLLAWEGGHVVARCGLWFRQVPLDPAHRLGVIGHYFAAKSTAGEAILHAACDRLTMQGGTLAVGPMDGSTWQRYRLVTERGDEPPFFLEPDNPDDWPDHFARAGFTPLARYCSALVPSLDALEDNEERGTLLHDQGVIVRTIDASQFMEELSRVYRLSLLSFADNFLYTPISEEDFLAQYAPIRAVVCPELVLLAEKARELVGFLFAVPDLLQAKRGQPIDTAIVKTLAVRPDHAGVGLGSYLMARVHQAMRASGYRRVIHALFHEDNRSGRISRHTARIMRRYTLFSRPLGGPS